MQPGRNHYEQAFASWLIDNGVQFVAIDQHKRALLARNRIKSFDFLLYPAPQSDPACPWRTSGEPGLLVTEVKGRIFKGKSLTGMSGMQCWVGMEDVRGLCQWQEQFNEPRQSARAIFVFAYLFELPCVETDGRETYRFDDRTYAFYAVTLNDYMTHMKTRSPRWQTVMLSAHDFRRLAVPIRKLLTDTQSEVQVAHV